MIKIYLQYIFYFSFLKQTVFELYQYCIQWAIWHTVNWNGIVNGIVLHSVLCSQNVLNVHAQVLRN